MSEEKNIVNSDAREKLGRILQDSVAAHFAGDESFEIEGLEELRVQIRIEGSRWGGFMNQTTAKFLLKLEESLEMIYSEVGLPIPSDGIIKMRISEGSWFSEIDFSNLADFLNKMEPKKIAYVAGAVSVALCVYQLPEIIEKTTAVQVAQIEADSKGKVLDARVEEEKIEAQTIEKVVSLLAPVQEQTRELQAPMRSILKKLDKADAIQISGMDVVKSKEKFTEIRIEKGVRNKAEKPRVDLLYIVEGISTVKGKKWKANIRWGEVHFTATIDLDIVDLSAFLKIYEQANPDSDLTQNLHVNLKVSGGEIREASIIGLGKPRDGAISLDEAMKADKD